MATIACNFAIVIPLYVHRLAGRKELLFSAAQILACCTGNNKLFVFLFLSFLFLLFLFPLSFSLLKDQDQGSIGIINN